MSTDLNTSSQLGLNMVVLTPRTIAVANQKGGVGKTTTVMNLGAALAERGAQVLIIDIDPQSNSTSGLGIDPARARLTVYHLLSGEAEIDESLVNDCARAGAAKPTTAVSPATAGRPAAAARTRGVRGVAGKGPMVVSLGDAGARGTRPRAGRARTGRGRWGWRRRRG